MSSGKKREKSKNDTWGEQELAKYIGAGKDAAKKRLSSTDPSGSAKMNPRSKPSEASSTRKDQAKPPRSSTKPDPKKASLSAAKPSLEASASARRETKGQSSGKSSGIVKQERDLKHRGESRSKDSKSQGRTTQKESSSKRSSEKDRSRKSDARSSRQSDSKMTGSVKKEQTKESTKTDKPKNKDKPPTKEIKTEKETNRASDSSRKQDQEANDNERGQPQPMTEVLEDLGEENYEYAYEDEFDEEEYEEDFDEVEEEEEEPSSQSEDDGELPTTPTNADVVAAPADSKAVVMKAMDLVEIMQAMDTENQMVEDSNSVVEPIPWSDARTVESHDQELQGDRIRGSQGVRASPSRKFVDFSSAQKRQVSQQVTKKTRKRGQELLSMIELDVVAYSMFDLPPLSEYEVYVKKFGADDTRQVSVQTGEDNVECEVQTEQVDSQEKWTQWPPEDLRGFGGPSLDSEEGVGEAVISGESALRLGSFLSRAGQVCSVLLEENLLLFGGSSSHSTQSPFPFCSSSLTIQSPSYLSECQVTDISHSPSQPHLFLATYTRPSADHTPLSSEGVVTVWSTRQPSQPQMVLVCQAQPTCTAFSPHKSSLAFAGNSDGSVVLWDLREPVSMHKREGEGEVVARVPTFSTAGVPTLDNHHSPVVSITPISTDTPTYSLLTQEEPGSTGLSFQLATLDSAGQLHLWVVVEVLSPDPHGSDSDLGLVPNGRVKLVKSSTLNVTSGPAYCLQFRPGDTNHLYVGSDMGCVHHRTRYGKRPIPKAHTSHTECGSCDVLSISFCPWQPDLFLAGYSDGSVTLHHIKRVHPLHSWPYCVSGRVSLIQWIQHRPGVFFIQDSSFTIYLWDLLKNDSEPVYKHSFKEKFTCLCLNQPSSNASSHLHTVTASPAHTTHNLPAPPTLTLAHSDSSIVVHQLKDSGKTSTDNKHLAFENYLNSLY